MANQRTGYVEYDGSLFRWLDRSTPSLEIYRSNGSWESWPDSEQWLDGTILDEHQVEEMKYHIKTAGERLGSPAFEEELKQVANEFDLSEAETVKLRTRYEEEIQNGDSEPSL